MSSLGHKHTPEAIEKIRQSSLGRKKSAETREKLRKANLGNTNCLGRKNSDKTIEKMRQAALGRKLSTETREKLRKANLGKRMTAEAKEKLRKAFLGRKMSPEWKAKIGKANLGKKRSTKVKEKNRQIRLGKKHSAETIEKMRQRCQSDEERAKFREMNKLSRAKLGTDNCLLCGSIFVKKTSNQKLCSMACRICKQKDYEKNRNRRDLRNYRIKYRDKVLHNPEGEVQWLQRSRRQLHLVKEYLKEPSKLQPEALELLVTESTPRSNSRR